jgi:hypothetical protein
MATTRSRVYGPPRLAADTALRLKADERALVDMTYTVRRDRALRTFRYFRCRWCGQPIHIQETDSSRHSARYLVAHARSHHPEAS